MWLIGREWKYSDVRSGPVLIDRGLDLSREPCLKEPEGDAQTCANRLLRISGDCESGNGHTERTTIRRRAERFLIVRWMYETFLCSCQDTKILKQYNSVAIAAGIHLFPCRTQQLSPQTPKVLGGRPPGRIGSR